LFWAKYLFNEVADITQFHLANSRTFKDLWNETQGLSSTCPVFKYFQGLEFRIKHSSTFKDFQECVGALKYRRTTMMSAEFGINKAFSCVSHKHLHSRKRY